MFEMAIFTDDISQDLDHALDVVQELGVSWVEIRSAWGKNLVFQEEAQVQRIAELIHDRGLRVPCVAAPIFKSRLHGRGESSQHLFHAEERDELNEQLALLRRAAQIARLFNTNLVRCFSFWKTEEGLDEIWPELLNAFQVAVQIAEEENIILAMENDFECNLGSAAQAVRLMESIDSPHLRLLWDPGNAFFVGETPYPDGYELARRVLGHVHVKDAVRDPRRGAAEWVALGTGQVDLLGQLRALKTDGYTGVVSMENHYWPAGDMETGVRRSFAGLQELMAEV